MRAIAQALIAASHGRTQRTAESVAERLANAVCHHIAIANPKPCASYYNPGLRDLAAKRYLAKCQRRTRLRNALQYAYGAAIGIALIALHSLTHGA